MKYSIIENNKVVNHAEASAEFAATQPGWIAAGAESIGDIWDGAQFTKPGADTKAAIATINTDFEAEMLAISSLYPDSEREGWPNQQTEANAFQANPQAPTPILDAIVAVSGETKADLAANIVAKVAAYSAYYGAALGRKRKKISELPT